MGQHGDLRMSPKGMGHRQRFSVEHVEHGMLQVAAVQCGQQIGVDHMGAARQVRQAGSTGHACQRGRVEEAARGSGERQQVDDDMRSRQHRRQGGVAGRGVHAFDARLPRAPAQHTIAVVRQALGHRASHLAQAQHGHGDVLCAPLFLLAPSPLALMCCISVVAPVQAEHGPQGRLGHGLVHGGIDHARQWNLGRYGRIGQQAVHAGPQRLDQPQLRQTPQGAGPWVGHQGHVDGVGALGAIGAIGTIGAQPGAGTNQPFARQRRMQCGPPRGPFFRREIRRHQNAHQATSVLCTTVFALGLPGGLMLAPPQRPSSLGQPLRQPLQSPMHRCLAYGRAVTRELQ